MKLRKAVSFVLVATILFSVCAFGVAASKPDKPENDAPFVFVHGFNGWGDGEGINDILPYWGATTGDLMEYLGSEGYECYSSSVGPLNSAWDRACELYAQILGTRVDYGAAHSAQFNHSRYGRTYKTALVPDWGELNDEGKIKQIHFIGHSFGGTTIRMLIHLLSNGSAEEIEATPSNEISPLFTGGKSKWVKSATAVTTPHNSCSIYYVLDFFGIDDIVMNISLAYVTLMGRTPLNGTYVDFHMEHFGLSEDPYTGEAGKIIPSYINAHKNQQDTCQHDLTPEGAKKINDKLDICEDVYYFSYPFSTTVPIKALGIEIPRIQTNPVIALIGLITGMMKFTDPVTGVVYDEKWLANDSLVQTESAKHPIDEPYADYNPDSVEKGIWNVMPVSTGDHGTAIGLLAEKESTQTFYLEMCEMLNALPD